MSTADLPQTTPCLIAPRKKGGFHLADLRLRPLRSDEALVEVVACGLCHSDLSAEEGGMPVSFPGVFGHEGAALTLSHPSLPPKTPVLLSFSSCSDCRTCRRGHPAYCDTWIPMNFFGHTMGEMIDGTGAKDGGEVKGRFFGQSSFARYAIVHLSSIIPLPPSTPHSLLPTYAPLGCGLQTGAGTMLNVLKPLPGDSVAVWGLGAVGMGAVMASKLTPASTIIAVDISPSRLQLAKELGATHTIDGSIDAQELKAKVLEATGGRGVDWIVECTGVGKVVNSLPALLARLGTLCSVGSPPFGVTLSIEVATFIPNGGRYTTSCMGDAVPKDFLPFLISLHQRGLFPIDKLIKTFRFADQFDDAVQAMKNGEVIKPVLLWE